MRSALNLQQKPYNSRALIIFFFCVCFFFLKKKKPCLLRHEWKMLQAIAHNDRSPRQCAKILALRTGF